MTSIVKKPTTSTELRGGAGFTYEDTVVAYYLVALLREEHAAGQQGIVTSVAVQQAPGNPMDDVIVEFREDGARRLLSLQVKRPLRISAAASNTDFRDIMTSAVAIRRTVDFQVEVDAYGFAVEHVAVKRLRSLNRLIEWAKSSPDDVSFARRFEKGGSAAAGERSLCRELAPLIDAQSLDDERHFYAQFVALKFDGLVDRGIMRTDIINRLQELIAVNKDGQPLLLFDRLCQIARDGAASGRKWTRQTLLAQLRAAVRLTVTPNCRVYPGFPTIFRGLSEFFVGDLRERPCGSSWKTHSVFQGAVGAFCASTAPSASTGPVRVRQNGSRGGDCELDRRRPRTAVDP